VRWRAIRLPFRPERFSIIRGVARKKNSSNEPAQQNQFPEWIQQNDPTGK